MPGGVASGWAPFVPLGRPALAQAVPTYQRPPIYTISGVTKDSTGTPLPNCNVDIFNTATREFVANTTSDAAGSYVANVPAAGLFFGVFYKAGAPDVAGTTVNTLAAVAG